MGTSKKINSDRRFSGGGRRPDLKEAKRREATERLEYWSKLGPKQQLEALDRHLGVNVGARKQRARLQRLIDGPKPKS